LGGELRVGVFKGGPESYFGPAGEADTPYRAAHAEFAAGNLIVEAIIAGALDLGSMSEIPPIFVAASRPPLRQVAVLRGDVNTQVVLVPKDSPVRQSEELRGKTVGYVRATTSQYLLLKLLEEKGMTLADIRPVALTPQDGRAAFERGSLDAWVAYGAQATLVRAKDGARVLATGLGRLSGNYLYAASPAALADPARRAAIVDYLGRVARAYAWANAHPADAANLQSLATGAPAAIFELESKERSAPPALGPVDAAAITSQQTVADGFAKAGVLPASVDVTDLWDRSLTPELAKLHCVAAT
jgi:sulfonate transport system substrate-binding protein